MLLVWGSNTSEFPVSEETEPGKLGAVSVKRGTVAGEDKVAMLSKRKVGNDAVTVAYYVTVSVGGVCREALVDKVARVTVGTSALLREVPELQAGVAESLVGWVTGSSGRQVQLVGELNFFFRLGGAESLPHRIVILND